MDKRHLHRVGHDARATLAVDAQTWTCTVEGLSLKGGLVKLADNWSLDPTRHYHLSIHLTHSIHIDMEVALAHQEGQYAGFRLLVKSSG